MKTKKLYQIMICLSILIIGWQITIAATPIQVSGIVTFAKNGTSLSGAYVQIKNTKKGTVTDTSGYYSISTNKGDKLIFSFIGLKTQEVTVTQNTINVTMKEDPIILNEAIITNCMTKTNVSYCGPTTTSQTRGVSACVMPNVRSAEEYGNFKPNSFIDVLAQPLSTFSIDVDAASYANMRRYINGGNLPPDNSIRSEELINYFTYNYPQPSGNEPVSISTEVAECPWQTKHRLVHIGLKAKEIEKENLPASNLVFLIDVSGSMYDFNKLPLLKSSLKLLVKQLRDKDRVAIVTYAGSAGEVLPSTSGKDKTKILEALEILEAGGSTAGGAGIKKAYSIARQNFIQGGNNRVILATDGDFNVGASSESELEKQIEQERESGIFLTILGYGMGNYKDNKMQILAQKGNGNHAYIDNLNEAKKVLVNEFGSTLFTVAKDVKLQIEFNPAKVQAYRLIGYESRLLNKEDFNNDKKDAGEIGTGHTVTALYEIIPVGVKTIVDKLKYQKTNTQNTLTNSSELLTIKLRYKHPRSTTSLKMERVVTDQNIPFYKTSDDFRFSAAVAGFGMLLTHSDYSNDLTFQKVIDLASKSQGKDPDGCRKEFIRLVENAELLK